MPNIGWPKAHNEQFEANKFRTSKKHCFGVIILINIFYDCNLLHFIYSTSHYPIDYGKKWSISKLHGLIEMWILKKWALIMEKIKASQKKQSQEII